MATSAPTAQLEQIRDWIKDLDDADSARREEAFGRLLGLERADLQALRHAAGGFLPLSPAQAAALHQVVVHVFLTGETYEANRTAGFLGVRLGDVVELNLAAGDQQPANQRSGVVIIDRMPGFCGYQALRDGDIIVAITDRPATLISSLENLRVVIQSFAAGQTIHMQIIRQGQLVGVQAVLDGTPVQVNQMPLEQMLRDRQTKAEKYWWEHFGELLTRPST
jgi:S1-C subfamily serine protease